MPARRFTNDSQPAPLVRAQVALYLWAPYAAVRDLLAGGLSGGLLALVIATSFFAVVSAYTISNESKLGCWLALVLCAAAVLPLADELTRKPAVVVRPDFLAAVAFPLAIALWLNDRSARDYRRVWFR